MASCDVCQRHKYDTLAPGGLLQPLPVPTQVWADLSIDFIFGLPRAQGKDTIMVVVDCLMKFAHFIPLGHPFTGKEVAQCFVEKVVRLHGFPSSIVSDRDRLFLSSFWSELFKAVDTRLKYSTAYHPQSDDQTEVVNRCLEAYLCCFTSEKPTQWLPWAKFWFNSTYNSSTCMTPFQALNGRDPPTIFRGETSPYKVEEVRRLTAERDDILA